MSIKSVIDSNFDNIQLFNSICLPYKMTTITSYLNAIGIVMNYDRASNVPRIPLIKMAVFFRDLRK